MDKRHFDKHYEPLHRGESKARARAFTIGLGTVIAASIFGNGVNAYYFKQEQDAKLEREVVYPALDTYLYDQGYPETRRLYINFETNSFSFITLLDEGKLNMCAGSYEYHKDKPLKVGHIACLDLEPPETPPPAPVSL